MNKKTTLLIVFYTLCCVASFLFVISLEKDGGLNLGLCKVLLGVLYCLLLREAVSPPEGW